MTRVLLSLLLLVAPAMAQLRNPQKPATKPEAGAPAEPDSTAIGALFLLPKDAAVQIARVEGPDGRPFPERWYVIVRDQAAPRGLRELVYSGGKLIANRTLSQFADAVAGEEVFQAAAVKINNDQAAGIAAQFAMANNKQMSSIRYELMKGSAGGPVWKLTCSGPDGRAMGSIVLSASKGTLVSYEGFEKSPMTPEPDRPTTVASTEPPADKTTTGPSTPKRPTNRAPKPATPTPDPKPGGIGGLFRRVFH